MRRVRRGPREIEDFVGWKPQEDAFMPSPERIANAMRKLAQY